MSTSVEILIEADDQASKKFRDVANNAEQSIKRVKTTGDRVKKSAEFFGVLANNLGGTELGSYASGLAQVTGKVSQFSEVSNLGAKGATAFRLGLVSVVGTISVGVGKALGDIVFQTDSWKKKMDEAKVSADALADAALRIREKSFSAGLSEVELIPDSEDKQLAYKMLFDATQKNVAGLKSRVQELKTEVEKADKAWLVSFSGVGVELGAKLNPLMAQQAESNRNELEQNKKTLAVEEKRLETLREMIQPRDASVNSAIEMIRREKSLEESRKSTNAGMRQQISDLEKKGYVLRDNEKIVERAGMNEHQLLKLTLEKLLEKESALDRQAIVNAEMTADMMAYADETERSTKTIKEAADLEAKRLELAKERTEDLLASEKERLALRQLELEKGKEAAQVQRLMNQGIDEANAKAIAGLDAQLTMAEEMKRSKEKESEIGKGLEKTRLDSTTNTAVQGRLLTRGSGGVDPVAANTKALLEEQKRANAEAARARTAEATKGPVINLVGIA